MPSRHASRSPRRRSRSRSRDRRRRRRRSRSASASPRSRTRSNSPSRRGRDRPKRSSPSRERRSPGKPNSDLIKQLLTQQQVGANPQVTKQARRIYVGNMPLASSYTESALIQFFTNAAANCGITTPHPVVSVWTSSDGSFCFVEMRAVSDATRCIDRWDGLQLGGRTLRVGRPADYSPVLPHLDTFVMDIAGLPPAPEDCTGRLRASTLATPILKDGSETETSNVLILSNMCTRDELLVDEEYEDIILDVRAECQKFGPVEDVWIPKPSKEGKEYDPPGVGKILICFQSMADALSARQTLKTRAFNGRPVGALYFPLQQFEDRFIQ